MAQSKSSLQLSCCLHQNLAATLHSSAKNPSNMATPKFSLSLGKKGPAPVKPKKLSSALQDDDGAAVEVEGKVEAVTSLDREGGWVTNGPKITPKELIIPAQPNRKRQRTPPGAKVETNGADHADDLDAGPAKTYGLTVFEKKTADLSEQPEASTAGVHKVEEKAKTDDELAMQALLGKGSTSAPIIEALTEEEVLKNDLDNAPVEPPDYDKVGVFDFGAAMLRGMGWKEGMALGRPRGQAVVQPREVKRRAALLGIGAKESPDGVANTELGAWGKADKGKSKVKQSYNPVALQNKNTGEILTEEELQAKIENQKMLDKDQRNGRAGRSRSPKRDSDYRSSEKSSRRLRLEDGDYDRRDKDRSRRGRDSDYDDERDRDRDRDRRDRDRKRRDKDRDYDERSHRSSRHGSPSRDDKYKRRKDDYDSRDRDRHSSRRDRRDRDPDRHDSDRRRR